MSSAHLYLPQQIEIGVIYNIASLLLDILKLLIKAKKEK